MSKIFNDNPVKPLDAAVYWIEYVTRHGGAKHLRTAANELYWFQYYLLDVSFAVSAAAFAVAYSIFKLSACCAKHLKSPNLKTGDDVRIKQRRH